QHSRVSAPGRRARLSGVLRARSQRELLLLRRLVLVLRRRQLVRQPLVQRPVDDRRSVLRADVHPARAGALLPSPAGVVPRLECGLRAALARALGPRLVAAPRRLAAWRGSCVDASGSAAVVPAALLGEQLSLGCAAGGDPFAPVQLPSARAGGTPALRGSRGAAAATGRAGAAAANQPRRRPRADAQPATATAAAAPRAARAA